MGKTHSNKITTTSGFKFNAKKPLDDREVVDTYDDLSALQAYDGLRVYVVELQKDFQLINGVWREFGGLCSNFENGNGKGSVVQKNGGVTSSNGETVVADAKATGVSAVAINARTEANGNSSLAQGYNTKTYTKADAAFNSSVAGMTEDEFWNRYPQGYNLNGRFLNYDEFVIRVVSGAFACNNGRALGLYSFCAGTQGDVHGAWAPNSAVFGYWNMAKYGWYHDANGNEYYSDASNSCAGGKYSAINRPDSFSWGEGLTIGPNSEGKKIPKVAFGKYNKSYHNNEVDANTGLTIPNYEAIAEFGNGTDTDHPSNSAVITDDGRVKGFGKPKDYHDFIRLGDLPHLDIATKSELEPLKAFLNDANIDTEDSTVIDTLKEIQEYIKTDESGAVAMAASIQENKTNTEAVKKDVEDINKVVFGENGGSATEFVQSVQKIITLTGLTDSENNPVGTPARTSLVYESLGDTGLVSGDCDTKDFVLAMPLNSSVAFTVSTPYQAPDILDLPFKNAKENAYGFCVFWKGWSHNYCCGIAIDFYGDMYQYFYYKGDNPPDTERHGWFKVYTSKYDSVPKADEAEKDGSGNKITETYVSKEAFKRLVDATGYIVNASDAKIETSGDMILQGNGYQYVADFDFSPFGSAIDVNSVEYSPENARLTVTGTTISLTGYTSEPGTAIPCRVSCKMKMLLI